MEEIIKIRPRYRTEIKLHKNAKTREQFIEELSVKNPDVKLIGEYKGADVKTLFECTLGHVFYSYPSYIVKALLNGCNECRKLNGGYAPQKTHEQYLSELKEINSVLMPLERYQGARTPILHKCKIHNTESKIIPSNVLKGIGCKECGKEKNSQKFTKDKELYLTQLKEANPNIIMLGEYINTDTPTLFECVCCGYRWTGRPQSYINPKAHGCKRCASEKLRKDKLIGLESYKSRVSSITDNIIILDNFYINNQTPLLHKCLVCSYEWKVIPNNILRGHGCPECKLKTISFKLSKSHEKFISDFKIKNPYFESINILSNYTGSHERIKCECLKCHYNWSPMATDLLTGSGCPYCYKLSSGEQIISNFLKSLNIEYVPQKTFDNLLGVGSGKLSYDFYLPQYNLLVEYQGQQHEKPIEYFGGEEQFKKQQEHDRRKREYAKQNNINLLEIWYYDFDNIESILLQKINELKENNLKLESVETAISA